MRIPLYHRVLGYYPVKAAPTAKTRIKNLIYTEHIVSYEDEDCFYIPRRQLTLLLSAAKKDRLTLSVGALLGLPCFLKKHRSRLGIPLGVFLACFILVYGSSRVWRVEIMGNQMVSDEIIEQNLAELGFGVGSPTKIDNVQEYAVAYRLAHSDIAWMGIYTEGTTAYVKVLENVVKEEEHTEKAPAHLVASADALIVRTEVLHGTTVVKRGEVVKRGDALVLGWIKGAHNDTFLRAEGSVIGEITEVVTVEIPYRQEEKIEKTREKSQITLNFFEKHINIFKKTTQNASDYAIIERKERLSLANGLLLPVSYTVFETVFYETRERILTPAEAIEAGREQLSQQVKERVEEGTLLDCEIKVEEGENGCVLRARIRYTKNIALPQPFLLG